MVARIPAEILPEIIVARAALEAVTVKAAAEGAKGSDIAGLRAIIERQREALATGDIDGFHAADELMHRAIAEAGRLPGLWSMIVQIKVQLDRYRRLTLPQPHRMERALAEHEAIIEAIAGRDVGVAMAAMNRHLDGLRVSLAPIRDLNPDYFSGDVGAVYDRWAGENALSLPGQGATLTRRRPSISMTSPSTRNTSDKSRRLMTSDGVPSPTTGPPA